MKYSRKSFLKILGIGGALTSTYIAQGAPLNDNDSTSPEDEEEASGLILGLASYTTRKYSLDETLAIAKRLNIQQIAVKSMHMPMESSEAEIRTVVRKFDEAGLTLYGAGVIYMKTEQEVENAFRYAKAAKMGVIIGVPNHELLDLVEMKVKETNIKLAIHNHGPGDKLYPTPESIYNKIKSLDSRIGLCIDIGHVKRLGLDPVENLKKYAHRLYDLHLKDVDMIGAEGRSVEFGRGIIDIPAVLKALKEIKYKGVMGLEYEKDGDDVIPGLSECVGYAHGVLDSMK